MTSAQEPRRTPTTQHSVGKIAAVLALLICIHGPSTASATPIAALHAAFDPEQLGQGTTIVIGFTIATTAGHVPSPLTKFDLYYPANLGIGTSGLGLENCNTTILETDGTEGCPSQSQMGYGKALVEIPFGPEIIEETAQTTIYMTHLHNGHLALLFYAEGHQPLDAQATFNGLVLPAHNPYGGELAITTPLVPTLPGGPNASIVALHSTIGPLHLTYYEHTHGKYLPYHPHGIELPHTCPPGGFRFAARFAFENGTHTSTHTTVPCPESGRIPPQSHPAP